MTRRRAQPDGRDLAVLADRMAEVDAMPLDGRGRVPMVGDFAPLDPDAYPVCAGWAAARASLMRRRKARDALRRFRRPPTVRERWSSRSGWSGQGDLRLACRLPNRRTWAPRSQDLAVRPRSAAVDRVLARR